MGFRNLFGKEIRSMLPLYGVFAVVMVALDFFILYKSKTWANDVEMVLSLMIPFIFAGVLAVGTGYYQLQSEWKTNSIYLLLSLPIRGWKVLTAKLAAVLCLFLGTLLWIAACFSVILLRSKWGELMEAAEPSQWLPGLLNTAANSLWMYVLVVLFLTAVSQFAFLCGQLVAKLKWLVVLSAFLGAVWLVIRVTPLLSQLLEWTPDIFFGGLDLDAAYLHSGPFIVLLLLSIGLIWLNGYIFEKEVEV
ncbi:hypothetical protein KP806_14685 [Paenibacillus sp. N4]|uniref:hypothetical protein n=1 Tax=Paenibacillus vietnamensis TaxID=2590547 RepID=UPI001CD1941E|nr:hypothetical protein [Paenibacillus vietnamensis]MCA0756298.1 hypothetical protein [Paenibacillus vietnamensis]